MGSEYRELVLGAEYMDLLRGPETLAADVDLDALAEELIKNLDAQRGVYEKYLAAAEKQKLALVNNRLAENQEVNEESDRVLSRLSGLETERLSIAERILSARPDLAESAAQLRCEALCPELEAPVSDRLLGARAALRRSVDSLKSVLAVNSAMVENGSRIIHTTVGIITSVVGRTRTDNMSTYTKRGSVNVGKIQVRNLINRSV
jgi:hypothetical protein